jgi:transcriptional regulator with XRE-family HTH domain
MKAGMSLRALADRTGFSPSFVSQLENGEVSPSLGSLEKITETLGVTLRDFFSPGGDRALVVRRGQRQHLTSTWSRAQLAALGVAGQQLSAIMITLAREGRSGKRPKAHSKEEFALVTAGSVSLTLGDERYLLREGDSAVVPAGVPRLWANRSRRRVTILIVTAL